MSSPIDPVKIEEILGNPAQLKSLKTDPSFDARGGKSKSFKWEKRIQDVLKVYFEHHLQVSIQEEEFRKIKELREHSYILVPQLRKHIERINRQLILKHPHIPASIIPEMITQDFIARFDAAKDTVERYDLVFGSKTIELENENGEKELCNYAVIDLDDYKSNEITIIKEKKINDDRLLKQCELPDFAYYINGIPFIAIEVKTPETGTKAALVDFQNKLSYQKFLSVLGTDGIKAFIGTNPKNEDIYYWENYGKTESKGGIKDIAHELLFNIDNLLFYFQFGILKVTSGTARVLKNARVQQYFVLKKYRTQFQDLQLIRKDNEILGLIANEEKEIQHNADKQGFVEARISQIKTLKLKLSNSDVKPKTITFKNHFKHHTRTGKSFTFKIILNLLTQKYPEIFSKIYVVTHDLTVKTSLNKEFGTHYFENLFGKVSLIENRQQYKESIFSGNKGIYLLNMQKTELLPNEEVTYAGVKANVKKDALLTQYTADDVLFIIDEVHTHQNVADGYAAARDKVFINASYIAATATPSIIEVNGEMKNVTKEHFGDEIDNFSPSDAVRLEIVVPLTYEKYLWEIDDGKGDIANIKTHLDSIQTRLEETSTMAIRGGKVALPDGSELDYDGLDEKFINEIASNQKFKSLFPTGTDVEDAVRLIIESPEKAKLAKLDANCIGRVEREFAEIQSKKISEVYRKQREVMLYELSRHLIPQKLDIITNDVLFLKKQTKFKPKFFWIVDDIKTGLSVIAHIKKISGTKNNVYKDTRFGLDVSSISLDLIDSADKKYFEDSKIKIEEINGDYVCANADRKSKSDAIVDFESDQPGGIDVLIIVGKYLMGYDLDKLLKVYLDTKIKDIKKILQIATRASTKKQDKDKSFLLDLTLDNETRAVYERALKIYDTEGDIDGFFIDQKTIDDELINLGKNLDEIVAFMSKRYEAMEAKKGVITQRSDLSTKWLECVDVLVSEESIDRKLGGTSGNGSYWKVIKEINKTLKKLIAPKYYINSSKQDFSSYIDAILKINTIFFAKILYKEHAETTVFSNDEIKTIIQDTFKLLSIDFGEKLENINDLIPIRGNANDSAHEIDSRKKVEIKSALYTLSSKLKSPPMPSGVVAQLRKLIEDVEQNKDILANWGKIQEISNDAYKQTIEMIKTKYDGDLSFFIVGYNLIEHHKKLLDDPTTGASWANITSKMANALAKKIKASIEHLNHSQLKEVDDDTISSVLEKLNLSNFDPYLKGLSSVEKQIYIQSSYKKNYIDFVDQHGVRAIHELFFGIIEEILNKDIAYDYYH